ncbi:hypothetical protein Nepgr_027222 [Nepenthes gracilis]|uniref:Uncharacterized protein n=1 Tax=Nepenthes gracilis TaxID=150966 RepID=A0AAD3Y2W5_NEPGR|nr:hypothetical protein Nepgr_027222 [Nepenthes gracilis]
MVDPDPRLMRRVPNSTICCPDGSEDPCGGVEVGPPLWRSRNLKPPECPGFHRNPSLFPCGPGLPWVPSPNSCFCLCPNLSASLPTREPGIMIWQLSASGRGYGSLVSSAAQDCEVETIPVCGAMLLSVVKSSLITGVHVALDCSFITWAMILIGLQCWNVDPGLRSLMMDVCQASVKIAVEVRRALKPWSCRFDFCLQVAMLSNLQSSLKADRYVYDVGDFAGGCPLVCLGTLSMECRGGVCRSKY